jgi:hypothetical protein
MDFPSDEWLYADADDFGTVDPTIKGELVMQLYVQMRPSGRFLDSYRIVFNGTTVLGVAANLDHLIPGNTFKDHTLHFEIRPRDIPIRRNLMSSAWLDIGDLVGCDAATVRNAKKEVVTSNAFLTALKDLNSAGPDSASLRWCTVVGADRKISLQLQSLPAHASYLNGPAAFKG